MIKPQGEQLLTRENMHEFVAKVAKHVDHVKKVGEHCATEETTKQALILPLLEILGFSPYDPTKVRRHIVWSADLMQPMLPAR